MKAALRALAGVVVGLVVAFVLVVAVEFFGAVVHPFPDGFGGTSEELNQHVAGFPHWVLGVATVAWAGTALAATWTARKIGGISAYAIVGLLLLAGVVINIAQLPYAIWFKIVTPLAVAVAILVGGRWGNTGKPHSPVHIDPGG